MSEIKIFLLSKSILRETEKKLLEPITATFKSVDEDYRLPAGYMLFGFKELFKLLGKFIKTLFWTSIAIIISMVFMDIHLESIILVIIAFTSLVLFAIPSTYGFYGIENKHVEKVVNVFFQNKIKTNLMLESVENNIDVIYARVNERIKAIRWVLGIVWLGFTFFQKQLSIIFNKQTNINAYDFSIASIQISIQMLVYLVLAILMIAAYKKGMDFIFNTIKFAIIEYKVILKKDNHRINYRLRNKCITNIRGTSQ